jgi:hypothetical protein
MSSRDPLIKGGQGRDEAEVAFSAGVCAVCLLACFVIVAMRVIVKLLS